MLLVTVCITVLYHHGRVSLNGCLTAAAVELNMQVLKCLLEIKKDKMEMLDKLAITRQSSRSSVH